MDHLDIQIRGSKCHLGLLIVLHGLCVPALFMSELTSGFVLVYVLVILLSLYHSCRLVILSDPMSIKRIEANQGKWRLTLRNGETRSVNLVGQVLVWSWLVVARFKDNRQTFVLVLLPDNVSLDEHRLGRVYFSHYAFT